MSVALGAQGIRMEQAYRRPLMASFYASFSLGGLAGGVLGGLLAWLRSGPAGPLAIAVAGAVTVLIAGRWLLDGTAGPGGRGPPVRTRPASRRYFWSRPPPGTRCRVRSGEAEAARRRGPRSSRLIALGLLALCSLIAEGAAANWSGLYLRDDLGAQRGFAAAGFAAFSLAMAAGRLAGDRLTARYGPAGTVRRCGLLASAGLASALLAHDPFVAIIGFAVCGCGFSCVIPQLFSAAGRIDPDSPGRGVARVTGLGYLGLAGGPALIGGCASLAGLPAALGVAAVLGLCVAVFARVLEPPPGATGRATAAGAAAAGATVAGARGGGHRRRDQRNGSCPTGRITISLTSTLAGWRTAYITAAATSAGASLGSSCRPGPAGPASVSPGWISVTRIPVPTHSARMPAASALTAHLVAEYRLPGRVTRPATDPVSSRWPPGRVSAGRAARAVSAGPSTFVATI